MVVCMFFVSLIFFCVVSLVKSEHPLSLMASIILVSLFMGVVVSLMKSVMFGCFVILVYVGGVMIAFCYSSSLTPNPNFYSNESGFSVMSVVMLALSFLFFIYFFLSVDLESVLSMISGDFQFNNHLGFNVGWGFLVLEISIVLVVVMVGVVSITGISGGALVLFGG